MEEMDGLSPLQRRLTRIKDERCGGNAAELARQIKKDPTYVNRLFYPPGKKGAKGIGLEIMAACNDAFKLPPGYWDGASDLAWPLGDDITPAVWADLPEKVKTNIRTDAEYIVREHRRRSGKSLPSPSGDDRQSAQQ